MSEQESTNQQAGTVSYQVPLTVTVDLDVDEQFRAFSDTLRASAIAGLVGAITSLMSTKRVSFSSGSPVEVVA